MDNNLINTNTYTTATSTTISTPLTSTATINTIKWGDSFSQDIKETTKTKITVSIPSSSVYTMKDVNEIIKTKEIVPEMVYLFMFADGAVIKTVCNKEDTFDFEYSFYLALAKKLFSNSYTLDGVMHMANELKYQKYFVKIVNKAIKNFYKDQKEEAKRLEEERLKKERHKNFIKKKIAKKQKRKARANKNNE